MPFKPTVKMTGPSVALKNLEELHTHGFLQEQVFIARRDEILSNPNYISIESLPNEMFFTFIFPSMSLLMQLRMLLVSKRWRACAQLAFSRATKLDFSTSFGDIDRILRPCLLRTSVSSISFANCFRLVNSSLSLINSSPSAILVKELNFTSCSKISELGIKSLNKQLTDNIERLILTKSGVKSLVDISLPNLEFLGLALVSSPNINFFNHKQEKLITIDLSKSNISPQFLSNLLTQCPNLEHLFLSETNSDLIEVLLKINAYCPKIKSLDISWLDRVNDATLSQLLPKVPLLERLEVGNCYDITDIGVNCISTFCPHLKSLDISQCFRITEASVCDLIKHCSKLQVLNVENCDNITAQTLLFLISKIPNLTIKAKRDTLKKLDQLLKY